MKSTILHYILVVFCASVCLVLLALWGGASTAAAPKPPVKGGQQPPAAPQPKGAPAAPQSGAIVALPSLSSGDACTEGNLLAGDDGSSSPVSLPFSVDFFGQT